MNDLCIFCIVILNEGFAKQTSNLPLRITNSLTIRASANTRPRLTILTVLVTSLPLLYILSKIDTRIIEPYGALLTRKN